MNRLLCTMALSLVVGCGTVGHERSDAMPDVAAAEPDAALFAISPVIAGSGDTLLLEGTFGHAPAPYPSVTVQFPGGGSQPATVLGDHRATVNVPASAFDGDLTVLVGDTAMSPRAFRRAAFPLAVGTFGNAAQPGEARPIAAPIAPRSSHTSAVIGGHVYVIGGISQGLPLASVERAAINADGSLGPFAAVTTAVLMTARYAHTSAVVGGYLYVIGGFDGTAALASVERAAINADGSLGAFAAVPDAALVAARRGHTTEVIGDGLFVVGGRGGAGYLRTVERATIRRDGSLSSFATVDTALTAARGGHTSAVIGGQLYVVGGFDGQAALGSVERAPIMPDGTLGPFASAPNTALATPRNDHTSLVLGKKLYVLGGTGASGALQSVEQSAIAADGSLEMFAAAAPSALLTAASGHTSAIVGNYLYALGGLNSNGASGVQRATINGDGAVHKFAAYPVSLITARAFHSSAVSGRYLYIAGGNGAPASVERAAIQADGSLDAFTSAGTLAVARGAHGSAVIGGQLYIFGGGGNNVFVERAQIRPDGSLGTFALVSGVTLAVGRGYFATAVLGKYLYAIGGASATASLATVERAEISPDGSLGTFAAVSVAMITPRHGFVCAVVGRSLYVIGGQSTVGGTVTNLTSIERATFNADGVLGAFAAAGSTTVSRVYSAGAMIGDYLYLIGGNGLGTLERARIGANGALGAFTAISDVALTAPRAQFTIAMIGNYLHVIGGITSGNLNSVERTTFGSDPP